MGLSSLWDSEQGRPSCFSCPFVLLCPVTSLDAKSQPEHLCSRGVCVCVCTRSCVSGRSPKKLEINFNVLWLPLGWFDEAAVLFIHAPFVFSLVWCLVSRN